MRSEWLDPQTGSSHTSYRAGSGKIPPSYLGVPGMQGAGEGWLPSDLEVLLYVLAHLKLSGKGWGTLMRCQPPQL